MPKTNSLNDDGVYEPFSSKDVPWEDYSHGEKFGLRFQQLGEFGGGSHVGVGIEEIAPGKQSYPVHYHMLEEEHLLILDGELTVQLGEKQYVMSTGDYVCFPAGQKVGHSLINTSDKVCRYLIVGERNNRDVVVYTESGRVGVRLTGEGYRKTETMDYWEGQDD